MGSASTGKEVCRVPGWMGLDLGGFIGVAGGYLFRTGSVVLKDAQTDQRGVCRKISRFGAPSAQGARPNRWSCLEGWRVRLGKH